MSSRDLAALFSSLPISDSPNENGCLYTAIEIEPDRNLFLSKLPEESACLLIATADSDFYPTPIQFERLSVQHGIEGIVSGFQLPPGQRFTVVTLAPSETDLLGIFLRFSSSLCELLDVLPSPKTVANNIRDLADMLQCLRLPNKQSIQGLWAELLLIAESTEPARWLAAWHSDPLELHDFCFDEGRVEVKSTSSQNRSHSFSHRQLWPPSGKPLVIASLLLHRDSSGESIFDLAEEIRSKVPQLGVRLDRVILDVLGQDFGKANECRYDRICARGSLLFFSVEIVPRLSEDVPEGIFDISYATTLSEDLGSTSIDWNC
jgi:hypothetical protein